MASTIVGSVLCSQCGEREAEVFIRRNAGEPSGADQTGNAVEIALCEACARSRGLIVGKGRLDIRIEEILASALGEAPSRPATSRCPRCGIELDLVLRERRLGCASCVEAFRPTLRRALSGRGAYARISTQPLEAEAAPRSEAAVPIDGARAFPFDFPAFSGEWARGDEGSDGDVVLETTVVIARNLADLPFVGNPRAPAAPSRASMASLLDRLEGLRSQRMAMLPPSWRRCLAEQGYLSRSYAADPDATLAASARDPVYLLTDDVDHLRIIAKVGASNPARALSLAAEYADLVGEKLPSGRAFAWDDEFGWIGSRFEDCGSGRSAAVLLHLPALVMTGMQERFFKGALAEGATVHGFYSLDGDASAGALYELWVGDEVGKGSDPIELLGALAAAAVRAERRARDSLAASGAETLRDLVGRAYGTVRYSRRIEASEGMQLASRLRLANRMGLLQGPEARGFDRLLRGLGPGALARQAGLDSMPDRAREESLRAGRLRSVVASAVLREGGD